MIDKLKRIMFVLEIKPEILFIVNYCLSVIIVAWILVSGNYNYYESDYMALCLYVISSPVAIIVLILDFLED
ncbi:hypothetical protein [Vibrio campbellii]